jgi:Na+-transporting methylmalonyl-CoA/oxaloacetate decarboxylase gamma subunit
MDSFLDRVWEVILNFLNKSVVFIDTIFSPLEFLGPGVVIFLLAFLIVCITRVISRFYVTKRFITLKKEFKHWQGIREEAMKHPDREKGKRLARNIDKAELNKVYYDYFFEGLLQNFITNVIPILFMATYVTTVYTPETLLKRFGDEWVFSVSFGESFHMDIGSLFWFVICIILSFILFIILKLVFKKLYVNKESI